MKLSLIVTTYNRPDALELTLVSILNQQIKPHEIIIADDGSDGRTQKLLDKYRHYFAIPLVHVWQDDMGFRAARIRNSALAQAQHSYIVFIDGDLILHPQFVASHILHSQPGYLVQGKRVLLSPQLTRKALSSKKISFHFWEKGIKNRLNAIHHRRLSQILTSEAQHAKGVKGCNLAFWRADAINVNGFNEVFEGWGREDSEFVVRMLNSGVKRKNLRCCAVAYHLNHDEDNKRLSFQSRRIEANDLALNEAIAHKTSFCSKGIDYHLRKEIDLS